MDKKKHKYLIRILNCLSFIGIYHILPLFKKCLPFICSVSLKGKITHKSQAAIMIWISQSQLPEISTWTQCQQLASLLSCQHMAGQMDMPSRQKRRTVLILTPRWQVFTIPWGRSGMGDTSCLTSQCVRATVCPLSSSDIRTRWQNPGSD